MKKLLKALFLSIIVIGFLTSCSSIRVSDYSGFRPEMVPEQFFDGDLKAHGIIKNRSGKVVRYFNADIKAYWKEGVGTLEEDFVFDNGDKQRRVWTLIRQAEGRYIGTAGDVIGEAKGETAGNSMFLKYELVVPYGEGKVNLMIDDRMYLVTPNILVNESTMHKFGLCVGEINLVIRKL